jgi:hypothetical protein
MKKYAFKIVAIELLYCILGLLLYRWRVIHHTRASDSDWIVFFVPACLAFIANTIVFWSSGFLRIKPLMRIISTLFFSILATFLSFWLSLVINISAYGE